MAADLDAEADALEHARRELGDERGDHLVEFGEHVRGGGPELALDQVVGDADTGHTDRGAPALACHQQGDAGLAHESFHALARHTDAVREPQIG